MFAYAEQAAARGLRAIIAGAGGAAHLPGMLAAKTTVPVLGVPVASRHLHGQDSLLSIVQMPAGIPVATFAIGEAGATNAALFAVAMLAADDPALAALLDADRAARHDHAVVVDAAADGPVTPIVPPAIDRDARRRPARPLRARRRPPDGLRHDRARPRSRRAGRTGRRRAPRRAPTTIPPRSITWRRRAPSSRPSSRTRRPRRSNDWPSGPRSPRRRRPWRSPRTASPRSASSPASACRRRRSPSPAPATATRRVPGDRQDGPPRLRRQGPARR